MLNWLEVMVQEERGKDLLREAERYRLVRQILRGQEARNRFHIRALIWLGRRLVVWGSTLQARYDVSVETAALQSANQCR